MTALNAESSAHLEALSRIALFAEMPTQRLERLAGLARGRNLKKGEALFHQDGEATGFFVIVSGQVKVFRLSPDGREQVLHVFGPGQICGEAAVFEGNRFPASAAALEKTEGLFIRRKDFLEEIRREPELALHMLAVMSRRLRHLVGLVDDLSLKAIGGRLAGFLLEMARERDCLSVEMDFNKQTLAARLGTAAETLSRTLQRFRQEGLIEMDKKWICIRDEAGLERLARGEERA